MRQYRPRDPAITSRIMSAVRPNRGKTEVAVRSALHRRGLRFRKNVTRLPGRPDIVFPKERVAVFIDGDFWHARLVRERGIAAYAESIRSPNAAYWIEKAESRVALDDRVTATLAESGWEVLRYWESEVKRDLAAVVSEIEASVRRRRRMPDPVRPPRKA